MGFGYRLGTFFILLGVGSVALYWLSSQAEDAQPEIKLLFFGIASLMFGIWQAWRNRSKPEDVERFTTAKKLFKREKKKK